MSVAVTYNGVSYNIPQYNDTGWAQNPGNLSLYLIALATGLAGYAGDITILPVGAGLIVTDAFNGHTYRILVANGVVSTQLVT
jgi:hypothetical protein